MGFKVSRSCAACGATRTALDMGSTSRRGVTLALCHPNLSEGPTCYSTYASTIHDLLDDRLIPRGGDPEVALDLNRIVVDTQT